MPTTLLRSRPGARVTVRGGRRTQQFIQRAQGLTGEKLAEFMAEILRNEFLPVLQGRVPRRTGRLARSLNIRRRGSVIELRGVFYGYLVRDRRDGRSVVEIAMDIIAADKQRLTGLLAARVRRYLGGGG